MHGVDYLIETLCAAEPGTITLCTLGPLTNISVALVKAPSIAPRIQEGGHCFFTMRGVADCACLYPKVPS
jgi:inosine-uridine nucleoside N-ribohydrolase